MRSDSLRRLFEKPQRILKEFDCCDIIHINREKNRLTDQLANRAIDQGMPGEAK